MKKIIGILIAVVLVFGLAFGIREVVAQHAQNQSRTAQFNRSSSQSKRQSGSTKSQSSSTKAKPKTDKKKKQAKGKSPSAKETAGNKVSGTRTASSNRHHVDKNRVSVKTTRPSSAKSPVAKRPTSKQKQAKASTGGHHKTAKVTQAATVGKAYIKVSGYKKQLYAGVQKITGKSTAFSLLMKTRLKVTYTSNPAIYVSAINGLKENDVKVGSGWMYSVNGKYVDKSAGDKKIKAGDKVHWYFSVDGYHP
ncbi:MAG: DUF4430 domain-containing protein [Lentilactobacillus buchneri]|jgi:cytoskeletal protein RodZ|nr:DUF4430 domain-containing protein [Lentilactobacillus buchneri]